MNNETLSLSHNTLVSKNVTITIFGLKKITFLFKNTKCGDRVITHVAYEKLFTAIKYETFGVYQKI